MSSADLRPCPFCGEMIKLNAIKCRFCGEFLDEQGDSGGDDEGGLMAWMFPMGNNFLAMLAGYIGILALIPLPALGWAYGLATHANDAARTKQILTYCSGASGLLGVAAIILGIIALLQVLQSEKGGLGRAAFGIGAGLVGGLLYPAITLLWFIPAFLRQ